MSGKTEDEIEGGEGEEGDHEDEEEEEEEEEEESGEEEQIVCFSFFFPVLSVVGVHLLCSFFFSECSDYLSRFSEPSVLLFIQRSNATNAYPNISIPSIDLKA